MMKFANVCSKIAFWAVLMLIVVGGSAFAVSDAVVEDLLAGNWEEIYQALSASEGGAVGSIDSIMLAQAAKVTNRPQECTRIFALINSKEDAEQWKTWTADMRAKHPDNANIIFLDAESKIWSNNYPEAIEGFNEALEQDPGNALCLAHLGVAYYYNHDMDNAFYNLNKAVEADPGNAWIRFYRGTVLFRQQEPEAAIADYVQCLKVVPDYVDAHMKMADVYNSMENGADSAAVHYEKVLELMPSAEIAYFRLGGCYDALERYDEAIEAYQKFIELAPTQAQPFVTSATERIQQIRQKQSGVNVEKE